MVSNEDDDLDVDWLDANNEFAVTGGYYMIPRINRTHMRQNKLKYSEFSLLNLIAMDAGIDDGIWFGNSHRLHNELDGDLTLERIQDLMKSLERKGYIKRENVAKLGKNRNYRGSGEWLHGHSGQVPP